MENTLKDIRENANISVKQLAASLGVSDRRVYYIESAEFDNLTIGVVKKYLDAINKDLFQLIKDK